MVRIDPVLADSAPAASHPLLLAVQKKLGRTPNLMRTLAHAPVALRGYLELSATLAEGAFDAAERERIALAVAEANGCDYCLAAHTALGKLAGLPAAEITQARLGTSANSKQAALVSLARALAVQRGQVTPAQLQAFRAAGWSDAHVMELIANVALNTLTNYVNHVAGTEVDFPAAPQLRSA